MQLCELGYVRKDERMQSMDKVQRLVERLWAAQQGGESA